MDRLSTFCTSSKHLFASQIVLLNHKLKQYNGELIFIHKYLLRLTIENEKYYIKANLLDNEFYLFSSKESILFFSSFYELRNWIEELLAKKTGVK